MQLHIKNLRFPAIIGIHEWEKARERQFIMQITLQYDAAKAIASDDFTYALDYTGIEKTILSFIASQPWNLIETLASRCAAHLLATFLQIQEIEISIEKPQAMYFAESVTATAFLQRSDL
jgi:FolB domain-containing protein